MIPAFQPADVAKPYQAFDCEQASLTLSKMPSLNPKPWVSVLGFRV